MTFASVDLITRASRIVVNDELKRQPITEPHLVKRAVFRENLKIQRNGEPVAECSRDRGIRLGYRCGVTRAKTNFCSVFRLDALVRCIISFLIGQPEVLVTQVDVGIIQTQDFLSF